MQTAKRTLNNCMGYHSNVYFFTILACIGYLKSFTKVYSALDLRYTRVHLMHFIITIVFFIIQMEFLISIASKMSNQCTKEVELLCKYSPINEETLLEVRRVSLELNYMILDSNNCICE